MKTRGSRVFLIGSILVVAVLFMRLRDESAPDDDDSPLATRVLRDIAATDGGGISWNTHTGAVWVANKQSSPASFSANSPEDHADIETKTWRIHIEIERISTMACAILPGMSGAAETQRNVLHRRVVFRDKNREDLLSVSYDREQEQAFEHLCKKHGLPGELDGTR